LPDLQVIPSFLDCYREDSIGIGKCLLYKSAVFQQVDLCEIDALVMGGYYPAPQLDLTPYHQAIEHEEQKQIAPVETTF